MSQISYLGPCFLFHVKKRVTFCYFLQISRFYKKKKKLYYKPKHKQQNLRVRYGSLQIDPTSITEIGPNPIKKYLLKITIFKFLWGVYF